MSMPVRMPINPPAEGVASPSQEFQKCGDIVQFGTFGAVSRCNWIYIQYQV